MTTHDGRMSTLSSQDVSRGLMVGWIDESRLTRECMAAALSKAQPLFVVIQFESVTDCLRHQGVAIDLVVYHSHDTDHLDLDEIIMLHEAISDARLVVLSDATDIDPAIVRRVIAAGASGFVSTSTTGIQMLVSAIALVGSGGTFVPREFLMAERAPTPVPNGSLKTAAGRLTARESEVLSLVKQGKANKVIAHELGMSGSTVKVHVRHIMRKMGATNRTQAAFFAHDEAAQANETKQRAWEQ